MIKASDLVIKTVVKKRRLLDSEIAAFSVMFHSLEAEGLKLIQNESFEKAEKAFKKALDIKKRILLNNGDGTVKFFDKDRVRCLILRAECRIKLSDANGAFEDAETALTEIKLYPQTSLFAAALLARAESLYLLGEFELALMNFHKGHNERPEVQEFKSGIQKTEEAIQKAVGKVLASRIRSQREIGLEKEAHRQEQINIHKEYSLKSKVAVDEKLKNEQDKYYLEELFEDRMFLSNLQKDEFFMSASNKLVGVLVEHAVEYLESRVEFWRQRNPVMNRQTKKRPVTAPTERQLVTRARPHTAPTEKNTPIGESKTRPASARPLTTTHSTRPASTRYTRNPQTQDNSQDIITTKSTDIEPPTESKPQIIYRPTSAKKIQDLSSKSCSERMIQTMRIYNNATRVVKPKEDKVKVMVEWL